MKPWLKAGTIGGIVAVFLTLVSRSAYFLPTAASALVNHFSLILFLILYAATGCLAVSWIAAPPTPRQAGFAGILAGLSLGVVDGTTSMLIDLFLLLSGAASHYFQFPPSSDRNFQIGAYILFLMLWRTFWFTVAIILGGVGGWTYAMIGKLKSAR